ncbi:acyltransferase [Pseudomonas sp. CFBP 8770]|uniref:acyltransferase family protein n=1 Tax=unclassified Pseudomonas TaxID=196821 RepID=UPI00177F235E|nr:MULTISPECIES: acyltransferase [unclassified Pseudomonas]MBD8475013.1 acyltransferase [Pseudomonas sp. CFBP 8773]MBD8648142.1 acyltransferase [Pseudomonas sp. CFBP 8770]
MDVTKVILLVYCISLFALSSLFSRIPVLAASTVARSSPLDALRGILATAVICHHFVVTYFWKTTGIWITPKSAVLNNLGAVQVSLFFMITGFLFFGKIYQRRPDFLDICKSRLLRIMPLYAFALIFVIILSLYETGFVFTTLKELGKEVFKWLAFSGGSFNGFIHSNIMTAGVHWTLRYEWLFYLTLPVIAALANKAWYGKYSLVSLLVLAVIAAGTVLGIVKPALLLLFVAGFIPVLIKRHFPQSIAYMTHPLVSVAALLLITCAMKLEAYSALQIATLAIPFLILALGNDLFGLLASRGLKSLGEVSYSLYLTHGAVLYIAFSILHLYSFENTQLSDFVVYFPSILFIVALLSYVTFICVEKPFIRVRKPNIQQTAEVGRLQPLTTD